MRLSFDSPTIRYTFIEILNLYPKDREFYPKVRQSEESDERWQENRETSAKIPRQETKRNGGGARWVRFMGADDNISLSPFPARFLRGDATDRSVSLFM